MTLAHPELSSPSIEAPHMNYLTLFFKRVRDLASHHRRISGDTMPNQEETLEEVCVKSYREAQRIASRYGIYIVGFTNPVLNTIGGRVLRANPPALLSVTKAGNAKDGTVTLCICLSYQGNKPEIEADSCRFEQVP